MAIHETFPKHVGLLPDGWDMTVSQKWQKIYRPYDQKTPNVGMLPLNGGVSSDETYWNKDKTCITVYSETWVRRTGRSSVLQRFSLLCFVLSLSLSLTHALDPASHTAHRGWRNSISIYHGCGTRYQAERRIPYKSGTRVVMVGPVLCVWMVFRVRTDTSNRK